jgi:hypothetical protein
MRVGQKNPITRSNACVRRARRGTRPSAPKDQRTTSAYLFGAICPKLGKGAALVPPRCDTAAMNLHLREVAAAVAPFVGGMIHRIVPSSFSPHAVPLLDQAGWRLSAKLAVPPHITLMPLPPKAPEPCVAEISPLDRFLDAPHLSRTPDQVRGGLSAGSSATTGCRTAFSGPATTSSITPAPPGGASSTSHGAS